MPLVVVELAMEVEEGEAVADVAEAAAEAAVGEAEEVEV